MGDYHIVMLLVGLLTATWFIRYLEVLTGNVVITTRRPPMRVISRTTGRLSRLLISDTSMVRRGAVLAEIENTTHLENVPFLHSLTQQIMNFLQQPGRVVVNVPDARLTFGDLQAEVVSLLKQYDEYQRIQADTYYQQQTALLQGQITDYRRLVAVNQTQATINSQEFANVEQKYLADKKLYDDKVYSRFEFLKEENSYLQKKKENETYRRTAIENELTLSEREKQMQNLQHDVWEKRQVLENGIRLSVSTIENTLKIWQQNYVLTAPATGRLRFLKNLTENEFIRANDTLFAIMPERETLVGFVTFRVQGMGKLRVGQRVVIRLDNFPYQEYGTVPAVVEQLLPSTNQQLYRARVRLPKGLTTLNGPGLLTQPELTGTADLVTDDVRLLERVFYGIRKLLN